MSARQHATDLQCRCPCTCGAAHDQQVGEKCDWCKAGDARIAKNAAAVAATKLTAKTATREQLVAALHKSVGLQSHYAHTANANDNGGRSRFQSVDEWLQHLVELGVLPT